MNCSNCKTNQDAPKMVEIGGIGKKEIINDEGKMWERELCLYQCPHCGRIVID